MTLEQFFASIGYNISGLNKGINDIGLYYCWYRGYVESFHKYYVFNGDKKVFRTRYSLNMPKKICETFADLMMNSKTSINLSSDKSSNRLNEIFELNNFYSKANQAIEKSFAFGIGSFVLSIDKEIGIKIQFVDAKNIIPLNYNSNEIKECAFISDEIIVDGETIRDIQVHRLNEYGNYVINNYRFVVSKSGGLSRRQMEGITDVIETNSPAKWFSIMKPNIVNNIDVNSPFGIPIFANSLDTIKSLDIIYDSFVNEIQNGRKRLFVTAEALKVNSCGRLGNAFDPNDVVFYLLDGNLTEEHKYVQEVNGQLRINELSLAIKTQLEILSLELGLGKDYYQLGDIGLERTATEVVASHSDLLRTVHKHEIYIKECLSGLIKAIQYISKNEFNDNIDGPIFISFDDSVIESDLEIREQDRLDVKMGAMSLAEYRSKWYGEPFELAEKMVNIAKQTN